LIKRLVVLVFCGLAFAQPVVVAPVREYLRYTRDVAISQPGKQNYLVVDAAIWARVRADLSDVRLYDGATQVPFALSEEQASSSTLEREARILNLGVRNGHTEFDLDVGGEAEYNQVQLRLKATNFVASATARGAMPSVEVLAANFPPQRCMIFRARVWAITSRCAYRWQPSAICT